MDILHKNNILHHEHNFENTFNDENGLCGFQDENGIYHWQDRNGMHDGNVSPFDMPSLDSNIKDVFHNSSHLHFGNNENNLLNPHEHYSENNKVDLKDNLLDLTQINTLSDGFIENHDVQANSEVVHHTLDNSDHVSFGGYYYTGPNGERFYKAGDGHTYDINNNKVD